MTDLIKAADALAEAADEYAEGNATLERLDAALHTYRQARESADGVASLRDQLAMSAPEAPGWYHHKDERLYTDGLTGWDEALAKRQWILDRMTSWRYFYADAMLEARIKAAQDVPLKIAEPAS